MSAEDACADFEPGTVTFVVPYSPGGGYDTYSRMIAPFLEEQLGATVVVENQPGAGGLLAINNLLTAPTDGSVIAIMNGVGSGGAVIAEAEGAQFDLAALGHVGRIVGDDVVVTSAESGPIDTFDQVLAAESLRIGATGPGAQDFVTGSFMGSLFEDLNSEVISGFDGSSEVALALLRGDLDIMTGSLSSRLGGIESGDERPLLMMTRERNEQYVPDTPTVLELDLTEEQLALAEPYLALMDLGRPVVAPPELPEETLACLRAALGAALSDPELLAEAEEQDLPIGHLTGEEMDQLVADVTAAPEEFQQVIAEAY